MKTWLLPVGCLIVSAWIGIELGRLVHSHRQELNAFLFAGLVQPWFWQMAAAGFLVLGVFEAIYQRRARVDDFRKSVLEWNSEYRARNGQNDEAAVHVIAHSFGTYLTGECLRRNDELKDATKRVSFNRVILVGSVLPVDFAWDEVVGADPNWRFDQVRNEVGERDWVVWLAGLTAGRFLPLTWLRIHWRPLAWLRFGAAGRCGFEENHDFVHSVTNPLDYCEICCTREERILRRVHNVHLPTFMHSDAFVAIERASKVWLPFLLGMDPWEYWDFRRLCSQAVKYEESRQAMQVQLNALDAKVQECHRDLLRIDKHKNPALHKQAVIALNRANEQLNAAQDRFLSHVLRIGSIESQLGERVWDWTHHQQVGTESLREHVAQAVANRIIDRDHRNIDRSIKIREADERAESMYADGTIKRIWEAVSQGLEVTKRLRPRREKLSPDEVAKIRLLSPRAAIEKALEALPADAFTFASPGSGVPASAAAPNIPAESTPGGAVPAGEK